MFNTIIEASQKFKFKMTETLILDSKKKNLLEEMSLEQILFFYFGWDFCFLKSNDQHKMKKKSSDWEKKVFKDY